MAYMYSLFSQQGQENLNDVVPEHQTKNKVNKERDKPKHHAQETKHSVKLMYSLLKKSDTSLWQNQIDTSEFELN